MRYHQKSIICTATTERPHTNFMTRSCTSRGTFNSCKKTRSHPFFCYVLCRQSFSELRSHYLERGTNYFFLFSSSHPEFANVVGIQTYFSPGYFQKRPPLRFLRWIIRLGHAQKWRIYEALNYFFPTLVNLMSLMAKLGSHLVCYLNGLPTF